MKKFSATTAMLVFLACGVASANDQNDVKVSHDKVMGTTFYSPKHVKMFGALSLSSLTPYVSQETGGALTFHLNVTSFLGHIVDKEYLVTIVTDGTKFELGTCVGNAGCRIVVDHYDYSGGDVATAMHSLSAAKEAYLVLVDRFSGQRWDYHLGKNQIECATLMVEKYDSLVSTGK